MIKCKPERTICYYDIAYWMRNFENQCASLHGPKIFRASSMCLNLHFFVYFTYVLQDQEEIEPHEFKVGWKLEALSPLAHNQICPATVTQVLNDFYFVIELDGLGVQFSCHKHSRIIFPCRWSQQKGIKITPPKGMYNYPMLYLNQYYTFLTVAR